MRKKIAVMGAGSWGTAVASLLAQKGHTVRLWARDKDLAEKIQALRYNPRYLENVFIPNSVLSTSDLERALKKAEIIVLAVPSHAMRTIVKEIAEHLTSDALVVSLTKGIELETLKRMSEVIKSELPKKYHHRIAALSGPNHAEEVSNNIPSATVVASEDGKVAQVLQKVFMTSNFRVYTNPDIIGVELGGATKNVIAIAAGISDGLGYGDNTKASLITRGLAEMTRLGTALGAEPLTFAGLSGMGDLIVTCASKYSRNRAVGEKLGKGISLREILDEMTMVAEGVLTSKAVLKLAETYGVDMPITRNVTQVLYSGKESRACVKDLMQRGAKVEIEEVVFFHTRNKTQERHSPTEGEEKS